MKKPVESSACCQPGASVSAPGNHSPVKIPTDGHYNGLMVAVPEGWFRMGADVSPHPEDGEAPEREVFVKGFALAATTVTIEAYAAFVKATGYLTEAERTGSSFVFYAQCDPNHAFAAPARAPWWRLVPGACWYAPDGPDQSMPDVSHPVTHVTRLDALAYCHWSGTRLPTEAEWEYAARGGLRGQPFPWGDELEPRGIHQANIWQGDFPDNNTGADGYTGTAPADSFPAHGFGHFNMVGNVWEWVADRFTTQHSPRPVRNPAGPLNGSQFVAKGGSYLCHASYCTRYRTSSRQALSADTSAGNIGFRVAGQNNV